MILAHVTHVRNLDPALRALYDHLVDVHYSFHAAEQIVAHTAEEGTPTGCPYLDREDEGAATEVFISALPDVPADDPAWDDPAVILDTELLLGDEHPFPLSDPDEGSPPIPDPLPDPFKAPEEWNDEPFPADPETGDYPPIPGLDPEPPAGWTGDASVGWVMLSPISGGGFDDEPEFTPSASDWDSYRQWSEYLDRRRATAEYLDRFNRERQDHTEVPA
jgi:hypothetical protein